MIPTMRPDRPSTSALTREQLGPKVGALPGGDVIFESGDEVGGRFNFRQVDRNIAQAYAPRLLRRLRMYMFRR